MEMKEKKKLDSYPHEYIVNNISQAKGRAIQFMQTKLHDSILVNENEETYSCIEEEPLANQSVYWNNKEKPKDYKSSKAKKLKKPTIY